VVLSSFKWKLLIMSSKLLTEFLETKICSIPTDEKPLTFHFNCHISARTEPLSPKMSNSNKHVAVVDPSMTLEEGGGESVTYFSTSNKNQSGFYCSLPPGSRLATKAQEICATMHSRRPLMKASHGQAIEQGSQTRRLIATSSAGRESRRRSDDQFRRGYSTPYRGHRASSRRLQ